MFTAQTNTSYSKKPCYQAFSAQPPTHKSVSLDTVGSQEVTYNNSLVTLPLNSSTPACIASCQPFNFSATISNFVINTIAYAKPTKVSAATHEVGATTHKVVAIPHECVIVPHECVIIPHECNVIPHECNAVPHECNVVPHECNIVPHECNVAPHKCVVAPHKCVVAPHKCVVAPHKCVVVPHKCVVTPTGVVVAKFKVDITKINLFDPTLINIVTQRRGSASSRSATYVCQASRRPSTMLSTPQPDHKLGANEENHHLLKHFFQITN
jgi:hypothetical protein